MKTANEMMTDVIAKIALSMFNDIQKQETFYHSEKERIAQELITCSASRFTFIQSMKYLGTIKNTLDQAIQMFNTIIEPIDDFRRKQNERKEGGPDLSHE